MIFVTLYNIIYSLVTITKLNTNSNEIIGNSNLLTQRHTSDSIFSFESCVNTFSSASMCANPAGVLGLKQMGVCQYLCIWTSYGLRSFWFISVSHFFLTYISFHYVFFNFIFTQMTSLARLRRKAVGDALDGGGDLERCGSTGMPNIHLLDKLNMYNRLRVRIVATTVLTSYLL